MSYRVQLPPSLKYTGMQELRGRLCDEKPGTPGTRAQQTHANYHARVEAALQAVCRPDYPAGMIAWLAGAQPALYEELISRLPDLIHYLWTAHAPLEEFQRVVDDWLAAHKRACLLFRNHRH